MNSNSFMQSLWKTLKCEIRAERWKARDINADNAHSGDYRSPFPGTGEDLSVDADEKVLKRFPDLSPSWIESDIVLADFTYM
jgi:hypothetical protein